MRHWPIIAAALLWLGGGTGAALAASPDRPPPLQPLIDATPPGGTLTPPPGVYAGPIVITKPITLDGDGAVTIDNGGAGTVVLIETSGATIAGLTLRGSGILHDKVDACVQVRGRYNIIKNNRIEDCLFGIDLQKSDNNVIRRNVIHSKNIDLGLRGDAIRLWYSMRNAVQDNEIEDSRDVVIWYSEENKLTGNRIKGGRYGMHFMYAHVNYVEHNVFTENTVGIFLMYSNGVEIKHNKIIRSNGPSGMGLGFKETSEVTVVDNDLTGNATGIYLDVSPYEPDTVNTFQGNRVAFNGVGVLFHSDWPGDVFKGNDFIGNFTQVSVQGGGGATRNVWEGNHWDVYEGFDRDHDGFGDTPFESHAYADRLWMDVPSTQFFRASPVLELMDFMERLAPFSPPRAMVRDPRPAMARLTTKGEPGS